MSDRRSPIFIVEDEPIIQLMIEHSLKECGCNNLHMFSDGATAVEESLLLEPEIIFMDIMLAGQMDGVEAAYEIRNHSNAVIIFMSANSDLLESDPRLEYIKPLRILNKPKGMQDITFLVNELLRKAA